MSTHTPADAVLEAPAVMPVEPVLCELAEGSVQYTLVLPNAADDYLQKRIAQEHQPYEIGMLRDMRERLQPGDLVVDVGANVGNHALYLAAVAGCRVLALEPNEALCSALLRSVELNDLHERVQVRAVAVGRDKGRARFAELRPDNLGAQRVRVGEGDIPVLSLDSLDLGTPVKMLKIDVEGMESAVLDGAERLLQRDRPLIYVECQGIDDYHAICRRLARFGYAHLETFNATPTHLFVPQELVSTEVRLSRLQRLAVEESYRNTQQVETLRGRVDTLNARLVESFDRQGVLKERLAKEQAGRVLDAERLQGLRDQLERAQTEAGRHERDADALREQLARRVELLAQHEASLTRLNQELVAVRETVPLMEADRRSEGAQRQAIERRCADLEQQLVDLQAREESLRREVQDWQARLNDEATARQALSDQAADLSRQLEAARDQEAQGRRTVETLQAALAEGAEVHQDLARHAEALSQQLRAAHEEGAQARRNADILQVCLSEEAAARRDLVESADDLARQLAAVVEQERQARETVETLRAALSEEGAARRDLADRADELSRQLGAAAEALATTRTLAQRADAEATDLGRQLALARSEYRTMKERAIQRGDELDRLSARLRQVEQERDQTERRRAALEAQTATWSLEQQQAQAMMREVFQVHDETCARERRARAAAELADLKAERVRHHLAYRLGKALVDRGHPMRWAGLPAALVGAWRTYRQERETLGPVPKVVEVPLLLDARHPTDHLSLSSHWQTVEIRPAESARNLWIRALSTAPGAEIDVEWVEDGSKTAAAPVRRTLRAGESVLLQVLPQEGPVRASIRKTAGKPCVLQFELKDPDAPERAAPAVATTTAPSRPAEALPDVSTLVYRSVPYMERRKGGQRAAEVTHAADPLISVIMTTYNTEAFVDAAIESILAQTWAHLELIVVDDCSTDGTRERVQRIARRDPRVKLHCFGENRGTYWCKNHGITLSRGAVITFMDSDDLSAPTRLAEQFAELNQPGRVMVTCNLVRKNGEGQVLQINGQTERIAPISKMIKREVIEEIGYFDTIRTSADDEFMQRVKLVYGRQAAHNVARVLYIALVREESLTTDPENAINLAAASNGQAYLSAPRKHFADSYAGWHRSLAARGLVPYVPFPVVCRPFPVYGKLVVKPGHYQDNRISVCIASFPPRREQLRRTIQAVIDRVDAVHVYLNGYEAKPDFLEHPRIHVTLARDSLGDLRDNGKFLMAEQVADGYCFTIDDDIDYPADYFEALIRKIEFYDRKAVVGLHGTVFAKPLESYFEGRTLFHFRDGQDRDRLVNQLGTGTVAFHTSLLRPRLDWFTLTGMADAFFAVEMKRRGIGLVCVARPKGWLRPQAVEEAGPAGGGNLFEEFRHNDVLQTELVKAHAPFDERPCGALAALMTQRASLLGSAWADAAAPVDGAAPEAARGPSAPAPTAALAV